LTKVKNWEIELNKYQVQH